jgi:hypothetical protein
VSVGDGGTGGVCCVDEEQGDCGVGVEGGGGGVVQGRGEISSASSSPSSLRSSTSHRLLAAFRVRFAGGGDGVGEVSANVAGGAGACESEDAVGFTKGSGSCEGDGARFTGRGSQAASAVALDDPIL